MIVNEDDFDKNLKRIGELYEEAKDRLIDLDANPFVAEKEDPKARLFEIIREMRDIACVNLKANHEIKDN